jgi:hypothetical protein
MATVSASLGIPQPILYAVLHTEGGTPGKSSKNTNGSYDLGPMQVNDRVWLPFFKRHYGLTEAQLKNNGCLNVWAGGVILYMQVAQAKDWWKGIGNYHSRTPVHHARYTGKVADKLIAWGVVPSRSAQAAAQASRKVESPSEAIQAPAPVAIESRAPEYRRY